MPALAPQFIPMNGVNSQSADAVAGAATDPISTRAAVMMLLRSAIVISSPLLARRRTSSRAARVDLADEARPRPPIRNRLQATCPARALHELGRVQLCARMSRGLQVGGFARER